MGGVQPGDAVTVGLLVKDPVVYSTCSLTVSPLFTSAMLPEKQTAVLAQQEVPGQVPASAEEQFDKYCAKDVGALGGLFQVTDKDGLFEALSALL